MEGMETAVAVQGMSPYITIWALFSIMALIAGSIFYTTNYKVGGEPLKWLEATFSAIGKPFRGITRFIKERVL